MTSTCFLVLRRDPPQTNSMFCTLKIYWCFLPHYPQLVWKHKNPPTLTLLLHNANAKYPHDIVGLYCSKKFPILVFDPFENWERTNEYSNKTSTWLENFKWQKMAPINFVATLSSSNFILLRSSNLQFYSRPMQVLAQYTYFGKLQQLWPGLKLCSIPQHWAGRISIILTRTMFTSIQLHPGLL